MWNFIIRNWLTEGLGLAIACIGSRYLYKHPRVRAFIQPAKELQKLITECQRLTKDNEQLRTEKTRHEIYKEGLLDEVTILRTVRDDQRLKMDAAKTEIVRMQHHIAGEASRASSILREVVIPPKLLDDGS